MTDISILVEETLQIEPYQQSESERSKRLSTVLNKMFQHHLSCQEYKRIIDVLHGGVSKFDSIENAPFIPVRLFKKIKLTSIPDSQVVKTMTSSGTTGQELSKIYLDRATAQAQTRALTQIMRSIIGNTRVPMLVIDSRAAVNDRLQFSARGAAIRGFSLYGKDITYALDDDMQIDYEKVENFFNKYKETKVLIFGFTFVIWEFFLKALETTGKAFPFHNATVLHGGGWKKLASLNISQNTFASELKKSLDTLKVINYYGMIEQTGSIFIRNPIDFSEVPDGNEGLIQLLSIIPMSYPGHSILSEDVGVIVNRDFCSCGRRGKHFLVRGRIKDAELRGCSDTTIL
jgi:phenylacetate-coenzyme A ligase PaaK-like adenylate-forming protein